MFVSDDGGSTWSERNFGLPSFTVEDPARQGYYAFALSPSNPDVVYLGLWGVGIYRSSDGTRTWLPINGDEGEMGGRRITALAIDPSDPNHVFVATELGVMQTVDGGGSWTAFDDGLDNNDIRALAWTAAGQLVAGTRGYEVYRSPSANADWSQLEAFDNWGVIWPIWADRPLYQYTTVLFHPTDPSVVYMGTFPSGIYRSDDAGETWRESNVGWGNDGLFSLRTHPTNPDIIYGGTYNGINRSVDGGLHWHPWDNGWPAEQWVFSIDFDADNPEVMYACSKNGEEEGLGVPGFHGTVMKSTDGGDTWVAITDGLNLDQEFYAILVDPDDGSRVYLATQDEGVWINEQAGEGTWTDWSQGLTNPYAGSNGNNVTANLVLSPQRDYLYYGTAGSGVFRRRIAP